MRGAFALLILALLIAGGFLYARALAGERDRLIADLATFGIDSVMVGGSSVPLDVAPTHALRVHWYAEAARIDPLFGLPGSDPQSLREAAAELSIAKSRIASGYPKDEAPVVQSVLFPDQLLFALPELESARRLLAAAPSVAHARAYHRELLGALRAYDAGTAALSHAVQRFVPVDTRYAFPGGVTDATAFAEALKSLDAHADALHERARHRYACMFRFESSCETLDSISRARLAAVPDPIAVPRPRERDYSGILLNLHDTFSAYAGTDTTVAYESSCYRDNPLSVSVWYVRSGTGVAKKLSRTDDVYFFQFSRVSRNPDEVRAQGGAPNFGARLYQEGARALYQISGNTYLCADAARDYAAVSRVIGLQRALDSAAIFPVQATDPRVRALAREEARIRSAKKLGESATHAWVREAATLLTDRRALREAIGEDSVRHLEETVAAYVRGSSAYDETLRSVAVESSYLLLMEASGERMPLASLLLSRTAPSIFFLAANPSVVHEPVSFLASSDPQPLTRFGITAASHGADPRPLAALMHDLSEAISIQERLYGELSLD